jgi:hypothetical protein
VMADARRIDFRRNRAVHRCRGFGLN